MDLKDDVGDLQVGLYSVKNIQDIESNITDISEQGVMFYYGESPFTPDPEISNERLYKPFLL